MKIIYNNIIPFKGFCAINLFGLLFVRKKYKGLLSNETINHEMIHTCQCWEMLGLFFYLWYLIEWIVRLFQYKSAHAAYRNISFEREAYQNESNLDYLKSRKFYSWTKYLKNKK